MYTYTHTHTHTHTHTNTPSLSHTCIHIHIYVYILSHTQTYSHRLLIKALFCCCRSDGITHAVRMRAPTHTCTHTHTRTHIPALYTGTLLQLQQRGWHAHEIGGFGLICILTGQTTTQHCMRWLQSRLFQNLRVRPRLYSRIQLVHISQKWAL